MIMKRMLSSYVDLLIASFKRKTYCACFIIERYINKTLKRHILVRKRRRIIKVNINIKTGHLS